MFWFLLPQVLTCLEAFLSELPTPATVARPGETHNSIPTGSDAVSTLLSKPVLQKVRVSTSLLDHADNGATPTHRQAHMRPTNAVLSEVFADIAPSNVSEDVVEATSICTYKIHQKNPKLMQVAATPNSAARGGLKIDGEQLLENGSGPRLELRSVRHGQRLIEPRQDDSYHSSVLGGFSQPSPTSSASAPLSSSVCPAGNGTAYKSESGITYQIICNVDYPGHDFPFKKVETFEACLQKCDAFNYINHKVVCIAALFVPSRQNNDDDCYLKSAIPNSISSPFTIQGAVRLSAIYGSSASTALPSTVKQSSSSISSASSTTLSTTTKTSPLVAASASASSTNSKPKVTWASGKDVITPKIASSQLHGPTKNIPSKQYIDKANPKGLTLDKDLLTKGVNGDLSTEYDLSPQTGILSVNTSTQSKLESLDGTPHISRDGGQGGIINGQHLFIFCDTGSYTKATSSSDGDFLGFVSSSVAIDVGLNGLDSQPLNLQDGIGQWDDKAGRLRGFAPLTEGEQAYNQAVQGDGQRYAVWPESPIISLNAKTGILYAPIIYDDVNRDTGATKFTYTGSTLLTITADNKAGPIAERTVLKIFDQDEVEWGCSGGIRSWGSSGIGGDDGLVYLFGNIKGGILLARTSAADIADKSSVSQI